MPSSIGCLATPRWFLKQHAAVGWIAGHLEMKPKRGGTCCADAICLANDVALLVAGCGLEPEFLEEPFDIGQRRPAHRARQPMCDLLAQDLAQDDVGGRPEAVKSARRVQSPMGCGDRIKGRGPCSFRDGSYATPLAPDRTARARRRVRESPDGRRQR